MWPKSSSVNGVTPQTTFLDTGLVDEPIYVVQHSRLESLAEAKVSARQQCVYEGP